MSKSTLIKIVPAYTVDDVTSRAPLIKMPDTCISVTIIYPQYGMPISFMLELAAYDRATDAMRARDRDMAASTVLRHLRGANTPSPNLRRLLQNEDLPHRSSGAANAGRHGLRHMLAISLRQKLRHHGRESPISNTIRPYRFRESA